MIALTTVEHPVADDAPNRSNGKGDAGDVGQSARDTARTDQHVETE